MMTLQDHLPQITAINEKPQLQGQQCTTNIYRSVFLKLMCISKRGVNSYGAEQLYRIVYHI